MSIHQSSLKLTIGLICGLATSMAFAQYWGAPGVEPYRSSEIPPSSPNDTYFNAQQTAPYGVPPGWSANQTQPYSPATPYPQANRGGYRPEIPAGQNSYGQTGYPMMAPPPNQGYGQPGYGPSAPRYGYEQGRYGAPPAYGQGPYGGTPPYGQDGYYGAPGGPAPGYGYMGPPSGSRDNDNGGPFGMFEDMNPFGSGFMPFGGD